MIMSRRDLALFDLAIKQFMRSLDRIGFDIEYSYNLSKGDIKFKVKRR